MALLLTVLMTLLVTALGGAIIVLTATETTLTRTHRLGLQTLSAAEGALEWAVSELRPIPDWTLVLTGAMRSRFEADDSTPVMADGVIVDLRSLGAALQREADGDRALNPNAPTWRRFSHGWMEDLIGRPAPMPFYLAVWVADDGAELDGDPSLDANGRLIVRAEAFGPFRARRVIEAIVTRETPPGGPPGGEHARLSAWRLIR
jgi:hypothetical protein